MSYCSIRRGPMGGDQYTQIHNYTFRDTRLTPTAVAVFAYMSTHSQGWETSVAGISRDRQLGPSAVKAALALLKQYHYVVWGQERGEDGTVGKGWYFITDLPAQLAALGIEDDQQIARAVCDALSSWMEENRRSEPVSSERPRSLTAKTSAKRVFPNSLRKENRRSEPVSSQNCRSEPVSPEPLADAAAVGESTYKEEQIFREDQQEQEDQQSFALPRSSAAEPPADAALFAAPEPKLKSPSKMTDAEAMVGFSEWYAAYPRKRDRPDAEKAWRAVRRAGVPAAHLVAAAERYAAEVSGEDPRHTKYPARWLRAGSYNDQPDAPRPATAVDPRDRPTPIPQRYERPVDDVPQASEAAREAAKEALRQAQLAREPAPVRPSRPSWRRRAAS